MKVSRPSYYRLYHWSRVGILFMLWCPIQTTHRTRAGWEWWHVLPKWLILLFYSVLKHLLEPRSHLTTGMAVLVSVFPQTQKCLYYTALLISRVTEKGPTRDSLGITNCYMASPSTKRPTLPPMLSQLLSYFKHWLCAIVLHTAWVWVVH